MKNDFLSKTVKLKSMKVTTARCYSTHSLLIKRPIKLNRQETSSAQPFPLNEFKGKTYTTLGNTFSRPKQSWWSS